MTQRALLRGFLAMLICAALAMPVDAQAGFAPGPSTGPIIGAAVGLIAGVVIVAVVLTHRNKTITGCVVAGDNGMSVSDEKDNLTYELSGNTSGIKVGERVSLKGKKTKAKNKALTLQVNKLTKDFGPCHP